MKILEHNNKKVVIEFTLNEVKALEGLWVEEMLKVLKELKEEQDEK